MENTGCSNCTKTKAPLACGICHSPLCKSCTNFVEEDRFSYLSKPLAELSHSTYCASCFEQKVAPEMIRYDEMIEKAKNIRVYEKNQGKETRLLRRVVPPVRVQDCADRQETLLRLAFLAAEAGYNGLIDVDIKSEKVIVNSYQSTRWIGSGVPINLNPERVSKDRALWDNPN